MKKEWSFPAQLFQEKWQLIDWAVGVAYNAQEAICWTQSLPPILEQSEAGATVPGLHSSRGREGERGGRRVSVAMCSGSLLSGGCMGRLVFRADMAVLYRSASTQAAPEVQWRSVFMQSPYGSWVVQRRDPWKTLKTFLAKMVDNPIHTVAEFISSVTDGRCHSMHVWALNVFVALGN